MNRKLILYSRWCSLWSSNCTYYENPYDHYRDIRRKVVHNSLVGCHRYVGTFGWLLKRLNLCRCYILSDDGSEYVFKETHKYWQCPNKQ